MILKHVIERSFFYSTDDVNVVIKITLYILTLSILK